MSNPQIDPSRIAELERHLAGEEKGGIAENKLASYRPSEKHQVFHSLGAENRERGFFAADQSGKTTAGGFEAVAKQYEARGLDMLYQHAQFEVGGVSVEAGFTRSFNRGIVYPPLGIV